MKNVEAKNLEKIRDNLTKKNLSDLLYTIEKEAKERKNPYHYTSDFKKGLSFTIGIIRNFFKLH